MGSAHMVVDFEPHTCGECGCVWGFPADLKKQRLKDGKSFYCPNGHGRHYVLGETEEDKLRRERDRLKQDAARLESQIRYWRATTDDQRAQAEHERRRANGYKGHATRITNRAKAGVCPCCNRTFAQLARHMATQHPQFTPMTLEVIDGGKASHG